MRKHEFITELFNQPYPVKIFSDQAVAKDSQGQPIYVDFDRNPGWETVRVSFDRGDRSNNRYELTGTGDEMRVFATVVAAIREWAAQYEPGMIYFSTENAEPTNRRRLYQRMVQALISGTNYQQVSQQDADRINDESVSYWVSKLPTRFQGGTFFFLVRRDLLEPVTSEAIAPVGPVLPMPGRPPRRSPPWPTPEERRKPRSSIKEFLAPDGGGDDGDFEEILRKLAAHWWNGTPQQTAKAQLILASMGWEIGEIESEEGGAFVVQSGDINGNTYIGFAPEQLQLNEELDEGWRDWVGGAALGAAVAAGGAAGYDAVKNRAATDQPAIAQAQQQPTLSRTPQAVPKKSITGSPHENILTRAAVVAGIKGTELAQFLAQTAHETGDFLHMVEVGSANHFKKYEPKFVKDARTGRLVNVNPRAKMLGNVRPGDGELYKGRGYIQLTGRYNYQQAGEALGLPLEQNPRLLERPDVAAQVAVWYWQNRVAPRVSDFADTRAVTRPINPGLRGLDDRHEKFQLFRTSMT